MEKLIELFKSKKALKFWLYFSAFSFVFFVVLAIDTYINRGFTWHIIGFIFLSLYACNSFRVSRKSYRLKK